MENSQTFVGTAWEDQYGITLSLSMKQLQEAIENGKAQVNTYGDVRIRIGKLREPNAKSKATHYVRIYEYKNESEIGF